MGAVIRWRKFRDDIPIYGSIQREREAEIKAVELFAVEIKRVQVRSAVVSIVGSKSVGLVDHVGYRRHTDCQRFPPAVCVKAIEVNHRSVTAAGNALYL